MLLNLWIDFIVCHLKFEIHVVANIISSFLCTMNYYAPYVLLFIVKKCWRNVVLVVFQNHQETCQINFHVVELMVVFFYRNACLNEKCSECGGLSKFDTCFHEGCEQDIGKTIVKKKVYEMVKYTLKSGGESSRCELVGKDISVASFISDFKANIFYKYARHSHRS